MSWLRFRSRHHAGQLLSRALSKRKMEDGPIVMALPRGGVPVAFELAMAKGLPLDVLPVAKVVIPEAGRRVVGAVSSTGERYFDEAALNELNLPPTMLARHIGEAEDEALARAASLAALRGAPFPEVSGHTVILVDDGWETGASVIAAIRTLRAESPLKIIAATPVASELAVRRVQREADDLICLNQPPAFYRLDIWYEDFPDLTDDDLSLLFGRAARRASATPYRCITPATTAVDPRHETRIEGVF